MRMIIFHNVAREDGRPVGMLDGYRDDHPVTPVAAYDTEQQRPVPALNEAWHLFNVGEDPAYGQPDARAVEYRQRGNRSLSIGDVAQVGDAFYACRSIGWTQILRPLIVPNAAGLWGTSEIGSHQCDECRLWIPDAEAAEVNRCHDSTCSLNPTNVNRPE